jgi:hypothetical protein
MLLKRTSPKLTSGLAATSLVFGDSISFDGNILPTSDVTNQEKLCGTYNHKVYIPPSHHKRRVPILEKAGSLIIEAFKNPFDYPIGHIFWHKNKFKKDGSYRKVRLERRESLTLKLGRFITHHMNLATQALGFPTKNGFHSYGFEAIAKATNMSYKQLQRTMALFIKEGYVEIQKRKERRYNGSYRSLMPIIKINLRFFIDLGIEQNVLMFHVERAEKSLNKEKTKHDRKENQKPKLFIPVNKISKAAKEAMSEIMQTLGRKLAINSS